MLQNFMPDCPRTPRSAYNMAPISEKGLSYDPEDIEDLLALNPKVKPFASAVPTVVTKKAKKHWKRNADKEEKLKSCG